MTRSSKIPATPLPTLMPRPSRLKPLGRTASSPRCSTTTGKPRVTTRSGRSPTTSAASTTPGTGSTPSCPTSVQNELPYDRALELGCGTGFFLLNLIQSGVARRGSVTDLSPGMVKVATRNGQSLGLDIDGRVADAEGIPYDDNTFDLVVGHAVLHHIPDVELSLREVIRVLQARRPVRIRRRADHRRQWLCPCAGGLDVERHHPSGEAARAGRLAPSAGRARRELAGRGPGVGRRPAHLRTETTWSDMATNAGAVQVRTASEEFTAAMFGLAGPHIRSDRTAGAAGLGLGEVRVRRLEGAELGGRQRLAARDAEGLVLQRDGHRGQAVLSRGFTGLNFTTDDVSYLRSESGAAALAAVAEFDADGRHPDCRYRRGARPVR